MSATPSHPHATPSHHHHPQTAQQPPITPTHGGLLPPLSPGGTPLPLDPSGAGHYGLAPAPPSAGPHRGPGSGSGAMGPPSNGAHGAAHHKSSGAGGSGGAGQMGMQMHGGAGGQGNVFGQVMGNMGQGPPGAGMGSPMHHPGAMGVGNSKVYASVYSGIPVFEAMIRGISVMRRTSDSWVNATQILKVAGIPKSARTKILEKEILPGVHEKVQGGYGKYQGTWIPFQRGQELATQYGVTQYLAPIFDFVPTAANVSSLPPMHETPDRQRASAHALGYNPPMSAGRTPAPPSAAAQGRIYSPLPGHMHPVAHGYANGEGMMVDHMGYPIYYPPPGQMMGSHHRDSLAPAADINGYGLPHAGADMYLDQYGHPHPMSNYISNGDEAPPQKRHRSEENQYLNGMEDEPMPAEDAPMDGEAPEEAAGGDDDSDDERSDAPPLPAMMRLSNKPLRPKATVVANRARGKLLSLFNSNEAFDVKEALGLTAPPTEWDIDMVIDSDGHTALHWACALARMNVVTQLIELGADIHRGNYAGETPLIRSVLTTNHAESGSFPSLLEHLAPSIRTLDSAYRTVVHHIALIAGVKGRASSARTYMTTVLEWVAKERAAAGAVGGNTETGSTSSAMSGAPTLGLKTLVDVQDVHGDTALNVSARVGNRGLVTLLLDAGADKAKANKLGLKPADFGIEQDALRVTAAEAVVSGLKSEVPKPERHSRDVQKNISAIFETISDTFNNEMLQKQAKLNATEASVRHATKALADKRQQVARAQSAVSEVEQIHQRSENVRRAMERVSPSEWTGSSLLTGEAAAPPAFRSAAAVTGVPNGHSGDEIALPERGTQGALVELRRIAMWEDRLAALLESRISALQGESADKAVKYRKLVGLCTKVPVDKVDGMLDGLVAAIESDGQSIDLSRISSFMSRMKEQSA